MDFFFGPVLICTISSNISNDSTQLKFSFNIFLWKICRQYPACRGLIAVSLLPLAAWWAPNRSVHPCFQGNSNLSALDTSRSRATLCKWPFLTERQAFRMAPGSYVYGVSSNSTLMQICLSLPLEKLSQTNALRLGKLSMASWFITCVPLALSILCTEPQLPSQHKQHKIGGMFLVWKDIKKRYIAKGHGKSMKKCKSLKTWLGG